MNEKEQRKLFLMRYPDLVKHLVVNDEVNISNPDISITARSKKLYYKHLFPDKKTNKQIEESIKNKTILDIGCGYNPLYDSSFITYVNNNKKKFNSSVVGMDIIDMKMPNYKKKSVYTFKQKSDMILINNFLYFWVNDPKKLLKIYKNIHTNLNKNGEVRIFPVYMNNYHIDDKELEAYLKKHFSVKMIQPNIIAEDPFYQDKFKDEIYVLEGLGVTEKKINKMLNSHTLILKKK